MALVRAYTYQASVVFPSYQSKRAFTDDKVCIINTLGGDRKDQNQLHNAVSDLPVTLGLQEVKVEVIYQ